MVVLEQLLGFRQFRSDRIPVNFGSEFQIPKVCYRRPEVAGFFRDAAEKELLSRARQILKDVGASERLGVQPSRYYIPFRKMPRARE